MKIISIAHQKGGVGKSTLTLNIANDLFLRGHKVAIIDLDNQGTTSSALQNENIKLFRTYEEFNKYEVTDYLIIDTPPYNMGMYQLIFEISDLVIIPTQLNIADLIAVEATLDFFRGITSNDNIKALVVPNRIKPMVNYAEILAHLNSIIGNAILSKNSIADRISLAHSILEENAIFSSNDEKAKAEINNLTNELLLWLK